MKESENLKKNKGSCYDLCQKKKMLCISHALFRATLVHFHLNTFVTISIPLVR